MAMTSAIGLALGSSWASGLNLYAAGATLGVLGYCGVELPGKLQTLADPRVIAVFSVLYVIEFFADKIPWVDSAWDAVHTFIRVPAGAALAYLSMGDYPVGVEIAAALAGGSVALCSHGTKAATRVTLNASPEPITNWIASVLEDISAIAAVVLAVVLPVLVTIAVILFTLVAIWMAPKIFRAICALWRSVFGKSGTQQRSTT